jgi:hypothetical protein
LTACVLAAAAGTPAATLVATTVLLLATAVAATVATVETPSAMAVAATAETLLATAADSTRLLPRLLLLPLLLQLRLLNPSRTLVLTTPNVLRLLTRMPSSFAVPTTRTTTKFCPCLAAGK